MSPSLEDIQRIAESLAREFKPHRIILFGSRADGTSRPESDVDLLVVLPFNGSTVQMMTRLLAKAYSEMTTPFALDVHPRQPGRSGEQLDPVAERAIKTGVVLYEAAA